MILFFLASCGMSSRVPSSMSQAVAPTDNSFFITKFDPAGGTVASLPATINIGFSQTELNAITVNALTHYNTVCNGFTYAADSVVYSAGSIITAVNLPVIPGLASGSICYFVVSANITNSSGLHLSGNRYITYKIQ
jgi:hypothetical protein